MGLACRVQVLRVLGPSGNLRLKVFRSPNTGHRGLGGRGWDLDFS